MNVTRFRKYANRPGNVRVEANVIIEPAGCVSLARRELPIYIGMFARTNLWRLLKSEQMQRAPYICLRAEWFACATRNLEYQLST